MGHRYLEEFDNLGRVGSKAICLGKNSARDNSSYTVRQVTPSYKTTHPELTQPIYII